jgi:hypothetical protein
MKILLWSVLPLVSYLYILTLHVLYWDTYKIPSRFIPQWWREYDIRGGKLRNPDREVEPSSQSYSDLLNGLYTAIYDRVDSRGLYKRGKEVRTLPESLSRVSLYFKYWSLWLFRELVCAIILTPLMAVYVTGTICYTVNEVQFHKARESAYNQVLEPLLRTWSKK